MKHSNTDLHLSRKLDTPINSKEIIVKFDKGLCGKTFKKDFQLIQK